MKFGFFDFNMASSIRRDDLAVTLEQGDSDLLILDAGREDAHQKEAVLPFLDRYTPLVSKPASLATLQMSNHLRQIAETHWNESAPMSVASVRPR